MVFSREFINKGYTDDEFLDVLYLALLGRPPDTEGKAFWLGRLRLGLPREDVFAAVAGSSEFDRVCRNIGITRGTYNPPAGGMSRVFATRLYWEVLGRAPDTDGLNWWHNELRSGRRSGANAVHSFIFSNEASNRNFTDEQFMEMLYKAMLGRGSDPEGKAFWVNRLRSGQSRQSVLATFVDTSEFAKVCRDHGIIRGTTPLPPRPLSGKVIILDPGHGTIGSPGAAGYNEAVAMLDLARRLRPLLVAQGATVIMTRDNDINVPIGSRCAMVNIRALEAVKPTASAGERVEIDRLIGIMQDIIRNPSLANTYMNIDNFNASRVIHRDLRRIFELQNNPVIRDNFLFISLHSNATSSTTVRGAEVYFIDPNAHANTRTYYAGYSYTSKSRSFGNTLLNDINSAGIPRRSLRAENYAVIREINIPAVLAENGFHTNQTDRNLLQNRAFRDRLAIAYRDSIIQYFK